MLLDLHKKFQEFKEEQKKYEEAGSDSHVLLIDGTNTYIRCFAASNQMDDNGDHIGGVVGFLKSIGAATRAFKPSRVVVVFDGKGGSQRRRKIYKEYKENRRTMEKLNRTYDFATRDEEGTSMKHQMGILIELLKTLPVTVLAVENIEADDTIAYISTMVQERGGNSVILSTDRDFLQLVNEKCKVYNPVKKKLYGEREVIDDYGIHPNNFIIYRTIEGDTSDNITGVKGVAKKTLIKNFPYLVEDKSSTIEQLLEDCSEDGKPKNKSCEKILTAHEEGILERNHQLMDLEHVNIAGSTKLRIINQYDLMNNDLDILSLTTMVKHFRLDSAFGNYDMWVRSTWVPLTRFRKEGGK